MRCLSMLWRGISETCRLHVAIHPRRRAEAEWDLRVSHVCDKTRYDVWNGINCEIQSQRLGFWRWAIITEVTNSHTTFLRTLLIVSDLANSVSRSMSVMRSLLPQSTIRRSIPISFPFPVASAIYFLVAFISLLLLVVLNTEIRYRDVLH